MKNNRMTVPQYLSEYSSLYKENPHRASLEWFKNARFGLFIHYGLYSLQGKGEWVMYHDKVHVAEYEKLKQKFTAENFDPERIAELAVEAGMKYINLVTRHHDSFCLFDTKQTDFNSVNSPAGRDLVAEMAEACRKKKLGLFLYYSYGADWRHPYFHSRRTGAGCVRPDYDEPEPAYLYEKEEDFKHYIDFVHNQLEELLTSYGPVAGVWFDLISDYYYRSDLYPIEETYSLIRSLQPQCLISYKQGATGEEDFMSQEMEFVPLRERLEKRGASEKAISLSEKAWAKNRDAWNEICTIMQETGWSYVRDAKHRDADFVIKMLAHAAESKANLLINTGPLPDGSIHPEDEKALRDVGKHIKKNGFPAPGSIRGVKLPSSTGAEAQ